ncbi:MAG TPA: TIGR04053 family radical SAM/SPASM domain-containing protein [Thermoplasmataceae archaeon]|nr:TIGR04053 family radical SAM/SPASM domain-containing protein [Thermoplasmataceae archaeon]
MLNRNAADFGQKPLLVFWETTKSCDLSCRHCRASAIKEPLPGELNYKESLNLLKSITSFGKPYPRLIITGGDPLKKEGLLDLLAEAREIGISASITPAVTERLKESVIDSLTDVGVRSYALSLDGSTPESHDGLRGVEGTFRRTLEVMDMLIEKGLSVQVNTAVMKSNVNELPRILNLLSNRKISTWAPFFLIRTGRGNELEDLSPEEYEDVNNWMYLASKYGVRVRTVESPIFRRIVLQKEQGMRYRGGDLYRQLKSETMRLMRVPGKRSKSYFVGSRDGSGVIFVSHDGYVSPSGFLPLQMENVKDKDLASIYRDNPVLRAIRTPSRYSGKCGVCEFNTICGGSRARAYYHTGDLLSSDPSCVYTPRKYKAVEAS